MEMQTQTADIASDVWMEFAPWLQGAAGIWEGLKQVAFKIFYYIGFGLNWITNKIGDAVRYILAPIMPILYQLNAWLEKLLGIAKKNKPSENQWVLADLQAITRSAY